MRMDNHSEFNKKKNVSLTKLFFYLSNVLLFIFYLFPGSLLGCFLFNNCKIQPYLTPDFIVSSNHVYIFIVVSLLGLASYSKKKISKKIIVYLFFLSVFLEFTHLINPERGFEIKDLAGNIVGVVISLVIFLIFKFRKKNEQF